LAVLAAYLIGSIPFAYVIPRLVKGIDIRTVGSGNPGATNVGRVLGVRYFWLVLALDALKGFVPTWGFPELLRHGAGTVPPAGPVLIALAAILGHTFPVYLGFRGGKGVATSLGAVLALDAVSTAVAVVVFGVVLGISRYMSLASLVGGVAFVAAHFLRVAAPFSREQSAMSLFSIAVVALLFVRHRANLARIWAGTENRVNLGRFRSRGGGVAPPGGRESPHPSGRIVVLLAIGLVVFSLVAMAGAWVLHRASRAVEADAGPWALREIDRLTSGQQRIDRVAFGGAGTRLAGICPRYNRLLMFDVDPAGRLRTIAETPLEGRPVSVVALGARFLVLERPAGDQKHLQRGWWELFDDAGRPVGSRHLAGFYPDDLAIDSEGTMLLVLSSGRAEGDAKKPEPALEVIAINPLGESPQLVGRIGFDPTDDPERLALSASGRYAAVFLGKSKQTEAIDLTDRAAPRRIGRTRPVSTEAPYLSHSSESDWIMMPCASDSDTVAIELPGVDRDQVPAGHRADYLISTRPQESALEILQAAPRHTIGRFPLFGPLNLGRTRPVGLAYTPHRGLLAVATRSGSVHLIALRWKPAAPGIPTARMATSPGRVVPR
jgi:glycerol-3-phosphate acyltransferase PlsY